MKTSVLFRIRRSFPRDEGGGGLCPQQGLEIRYVFLCRKPDLCRLSGELFEHEFTDAATFAEWGVDFLKYDYCYHSPIIHGQYLYRRMGLALENCGRDILFSACSSGCE